MIAVRKSDADTSINKTELYVYGGSMWETRLYYRATALPETDATWDFELTSAADLVAIRKSGGSSGGTEAHVLTRSSNYRRFTYRIGTSLPTTDATWTFDVTRWDAGNVDDLVAFRKSNTVTDKTEINILTGTASKRVEPAVTRTSQDSYVLPRFDSSRGTLILSPTKAVVTLDAGSKVTSWTDGGQFEHTHEFLRLNPCRSVRSPSPP